MRVMVERICPVCGEPFKARLADVNRGWGIYDNKVCSAIGRERRKAHRPRHEKALPRKRGRNDQ